MRIYELAKELNMPPKKLMEEILNLGIKVKSHMSTVDEEVVKDLRELFREEKTKTISIPEHITVGELSKKLGVKVNDLILSLMKDGLIYTKNQRVDLDLAKRIAKGYNYEVKIVPIEEEGLVEKDTEASVPRPPVVTIMGHVDHGKTCLLDAIREKDTVSHEVGGITQHIGAYKVKTKRGEVVFLDTPGHEAFTAMRARGVKVTDIVVLVIDAVDGVMPQTEEAIAHAKEAQVPIVVAINKIDLPSANPERVKQQLANLGLVSEDWGGKTIVVETSAKEKIGLENLLEMLLLEAEMLELRANPNRLAKGVAIEARLDKGRGPVATLLVQNGTLHIGDYFVVGVHYGKVRAMFDEHGNRVFQARPSTPVEVIGLPSVPEPGDPFFVVESEKRAKEISLKKQEIERGREEKSPRKVRLDDLYREISKGMKELKIIIKADVKGSVEALRESLEKFKVDGVEIKVIYGGVGGVTYGDIMLALASNAIVIGFHVKEDSKIKQLADSLGVDIRHYQVIYDVIQDIKKATIGLLEPESREIALGKAEVRNTFKISKVGTVAGCYVKEGKVLRASLVRLKRDGKVLYEGKIKSLKRFKDDVREVLAGYECGIGLEGFEGIEIGDVIEVFMVEKVPKYN
ncbi:MAG: translation initiation factor IF-2 [bacterium]|nr:translation initiation factor IF-2 [bacterium]